MTHLDDDSDNDSFLYDKEVYNPESELATNAFMHNVRQHIPFIEISVH
jgi:hypothetical protein